MSETTYYERNRDVIYIKLNKAKCNNIECM